MPIEYPQQLKELLKDSKYQAPLFTFANVAGEILHANQLTFFPDYTDHGVNHINRVLKTEVDLVPHDVWPETKPDSNPRLLSEADAVVIIGATILHDIAMHLQPRGFLELISKDTRFRPLPWFKQDHKGYSADRPWFDLWQDFLREARRFNERTLVNIIGPDSVHKGWKFEDLPEDTGKWERNHRLVIGEFIRRHHARLAHEIAIYGFPGIPAGCGDGQFPSLAKDIPNPLQELADLIGLTARSHWLNLRVCKDYLDDCYTGTPQPNGSAILYPMALLRVADYLQIDRQRAPAILLQLKNPPSPISVQEWQKHGAVERIDSATDPRGKKVVVSKKVSLEVYLQLRDLLSDLQNEMDHSTAVLDEAYGRITDLGLHKLNLGIRRIYSNLTDPHFRDDLPYVPENTGFSSDPNLLALLVEPLYGKEPSVGVRELMQNAVDAVRELHAWCELRNKKIGEMELLAQESDVLIEFIKTEKGNWVLRIRDKGIGMTWETLQKYFLRAGASFRQSSSWANEFTTENGQARVLRAGCFGIGAFAIFLLGPSFRLNTRYVSAEKSMGYTVEASVNSQIIEIRRNTNLPIGTTIEIEISNDAIELLELSAHRELRYPNYWTSTDWYSWDWPKVSRRLIHGGKTSQLIQTSWVPIYNRSPEWAVIHPKDFDAVFWTFDGYPSLTCNGIKIAKPQNGALHSNFEWPYQSGFARPCIAVLDSRAKLPLTIQRYELCRELPFVEELSRDIVLSFIAHCLICGPTSQSLAHSTLGGKSRYPLLSRDVFWHSTHDEFIPSDPWLYSLLKKQRCIIYGFFTRSEQVVFNYPQDPIFHKTHSDHSIFRRDHVVSPSATADEKVAFDGWQYLEAIAERGIGIWGSKPKMQSAKVVVSASYKFNMTGKIPSLWHELGNDDRSSFKEFARERFQITKGACKSTANLIEMLARMECWEEVLAVRNRKPDTYPDFFYVAEIHHETSDALPESLLAKVWNECLGPKPIPFDAAARREMIELGRKHPELKRHIEAWEEMKRTKSKWVTGGRS